VHSSNILDDYARPERFPCIIIRHDQPTYVLDTIENTLHIWSKVSGFAEVREIAAAIGDSLETLPWRIEGFRPSNLTITSALFLPRNDGAYSHGILSVEAILQATGRRAASSVRASKRTVALATLAVIGLLVGEAAIAEGANLIKNGSSEKPVVLICKALTCL